MKIMKAETMPNPVSGKQIIESGELEKLSETICGDKNLDFAGAKISYLLIYPNISQKTPAKVKKTTKELKHFTGYDYLIEISGELWDMLDSDTRYNLFWNQLIRVNPTFVAKKGEYVMKLKKPNYSNFYEIHDSVGMDWLKAVQASMSSLYDLGIIEEDQISLF